MLIFWRYPNFLKTQHRISWGLPVCQKIINTCSHFDTSSIPKSQKSHPFVHSANLHCLYVNLGNEWNQNFKFDRELIITSPSVPKGHVVWITWSILNFLSLITSLEWLKLVFNFGTYHVGLRLLHRPQEGYEVLWWICLLVCLLCPLALLENHTA